MSPSESGSLRDNKLWVAEGAEPVAVTVIHEGALALNVAFVHNCRSMWCLHVFGDALQLQEKGQESRRV